MDIRYFVSVEDINMTLNGNRIVNAKRCNKIYRLRLATT